MPGTGKNTQDLGGILNIKLKEGRLIAEEGIEARLAAADTNAAKIAEEDVQALLNIQGDINNFEERTKSVIEITTNKDIEN